MYVCVPECKYVHYTHPKPVTIRAIRSPELWLPTVVNHQPLGVEKSSAPNHQATSSPILFYLKHRFSLEHTGSKQQEFTANFWADEW